MYRATIYRPEVCECDKNGRFKLDNFAVKFRGKPIQHDALSDAKVLRSLILEDPFEAEEHLTEYLYQLPFDYPYAVPECYRAPNRKFYRYKRMSHHEKEILHCKWCRKEGHNQTECRKKEAWEEAQENASILKTLQKELENLKQVPAYVRYEIIDDIAKAIEAERTFKSKVHTLCDKEIFQQRDQLNEDLENIQEKLEKCSKLIYKMLLYTKNNNMYNIITKNNIINTFIFLEQKKEVKQEIIIISDDEEENSM